jgi:pre-mRNA-splicing factor CDC5/CEF1
LATLVGFPYAAPAEVRDGLLKLAKTENLSANCYWSSVCQNLAYHPDTKSWVDPGSLSLDSRIAGYTLLLNDSRDLMTKELPKHQKQKRSLTLLLVVISIEQKQLTSE